MTRPAAGKSFGIRQALKVGRLQLRTPAGFRCNDQVADLQSRNTPYFGSAGLLQGRSGQPGYDKLTGEEAAFEASATIANTARLSLFVRPVFLDSGTADGTSTLRFGLLPEGIAPPSQAQSGIVADVQLSTQTFGLRFGSTPLGFLVNNVIGGLRVRPANGPVTILFSRDSVKDTMLSYAGSRDPVTGQKWGGVIANTLQILGNWGGAKSGVYFNAGYQFIDGKNVADNSRIDGGAGAYYQILARPEGTLTVGLNFSAMHYDKNLRYFTLGQGGYFSPQQYFLFNIPVRWTGAWKQVQYSFSGSIGAQHFQESATPFFPTQTLFPSQLQFPGVAPPYYSSNSDTGPNYSLEARVAYQFSPYWSLGFFANVNNARDYTAGAAGVSVRYSVRPRPLTEEFYIPSLPDWRGSVTPTLP
jgi:cellulose synthase operon protein C